MGEAVDISAPFQAISNSAFTVLLALDTGVVLVGTQRDHLLRYQAGEPNALKMDAGYGIIADSIASITYVDSCSETIVNGNKFYDINKKVLLGTNKYLFTSRKSLGFDTLSIGGSPFYFKLLKIEAYNRIGINVTTKYRYFGSENCLSNFVFDSGGPAFIIACDNTNSESILSSEFIAAFDRSNGSGYVYNYFYFATNKGIRKFYFSYMYRPTIKLLSSLNNILPGLQAYKVLATDQRNKMLYLNIPNSGQYILAGTNNGLYYLSPSDSQTDVAFPATVTSGMKVYDIALDTSNCGDLWLATDRGLVKLTGNYRKDNLKRMLSPPGDVNQCNKTTQFKAFVTPSTNIIWQRNSQDLSGATQHTFETSVPGYYGFKVLNGLSNTCYSNTADLVRDTTISYALTPSGIALLCAGDSVALSLQHPWPYQYTWFKDNTSITGANNDTYIAYETGHYQVRISNCYAKELTSAPVFVNKDTTTKPEVFYTHNAICGNNDTLTLSIHKNDGMVKWTLNTSYSYELTDNSNTRFFTTSIPGVVRMEYQDPFYCVFTVRVPIEVGEKPKLAVSISGSNILCAGDSIVLTASTNASYFAWSNGDTAAAIVLISADTITAKAWFPDGCKTENTTIVTQLPSPLLSPIKDTSFCEGNLIPISLNVAEGYAKYVLNNTLNPDHRLIIQKAGAYQLRVYNQNNCFAEEGFKVSDNCSDLVFCNVFTPNGDGVNEIFYIRNLIPNCELAVYNRWGSKVYQNQNYDNQWDASDLTDGIYFYELRDTYYSKLFKGIVQIIR